MSNKISKEELYDKLNNYIDDNGNGEYDGKKLRKEGNCITLEDYFAIEVNPIVSSLKIIPSLMDRKAFSKVEHYLENELNYSM